MLRRLASPRVETLESPPQISERRWNLQGAGGAGNAYTGANVSPDTAMGVPAVMACVTVLTEDVGSLPWFLYRRLKRGRELATDHYLFPILHDQPNPEMTSMEYREIMVGHIVAWGNSYSQIIWNKAGQVMELWPLRPDRMQVSRDNTRPGKPKRYLYTLADGTHQAFLQQDILHVPGFGFDGLIGYSKITIARQSIAILMATEQFTGSFFANDARPGVALEYPKQLTDKALQNIIDSWELSYKGSGKRSKVAVLEEGVKIQEIGLPGADSEYIQTKMFGLEEVCRIFRIPPHKIQHLVRATLNNIEQLGIEYVIDGLRPLIVKIEQRGNVQLLTPAERGQYYNEILVEGLMRGDQEARYRAYAIGRQWGWLSGNDIRDKENLNPIPAVEGDQYLIPLNMVPVGSADVSNEPPDSTQGNRSRQLPIDRLDDNLRMKRAQSSVTMRRRLMITQRPLIQDVAARCLRREIHDVKDAAGKYLKNSKRNEQQMDAWLTQFYQSHQEFIRKQFAPVLTSYGQLIAGAAGDEVGSDGWTPEMEQFVRAYLNSYVQRHAGISEAEMRTLIQNAIASASVEGDLTDTLDSELADWEDTRSNEIAMQESVREGNAVAKAVYIAAGFLELVWIANARACDYCSALDGQVVSVTSNFLNAGEDYQPAGAPSPLKPTGNVGHPPAHPFCECLIAAWR
jgi:HK97 family phage portal protein